MMDARVDLHPMEPPASHACPLCGGQLAETSFKFVDRFVVRGEHYEVLTVAEAVVFKTIFANRPGYVPMERLYNAYVASIPLEKERPGPEVVRVYVHHIKQKLARLEGATIESWRGFGYRFVEGKSQ